MLVVVLFVELLCVRILFACLRVLPVFIYCVVVCRALRSSAWAWSCTIRLRRTAPRALSGVRMDCFCRNLCCLVSPFVSLSFRALCPSVTLGMIFQIPPSRSSSRSTASPFCISSKPTRSRSSSLSLAREAKKSGQNTHTHIHTPHCMIGQ